MGSGDPPVEGGGSGGAGPSISNRLTRTLLDQVKLSVDGVHSNPRDGSLSQAEQ